MKRVEVSWIDSNGSSGWRALDAVLRDAEGEDLVCYSCGYLVADNERYLLLALNRTDPTPDVKATVGEVMQIPRVAVLKVRQLR